ncbi:hypothetical protein Aperf_G00000050969 [Anoplocephala perfoliata]
MTSTNSTSPPKLQLSVTDQGSRNDLRSASPNSCYGGSPERVTKQNQLLQPVLLLNISSGTSSEVNLTEREERSSVDTCSRSENSFAQEEEISRESRHLRETNSKRIGWVKLIRLQLNALHEKKYKSMLSASAESEKPLSENKVPETDASNACPYETAMISDAVEFLITLHLCAVTVKNIVPLEAIAAGLFQQNCRRSKREFIFKAADALRVSVYLFGTAIH